MGERPARLTLERDDVNIGYNKNNCRWATTREQGRNKTNTVYIMLNGTKTLLMDAVIKIGITRGMVDSRMYRTKETRQQAFDYLVENGQRL